jgi:hypothetical protein
MRIFVLGIIVLSLFCIEIYSQTLDEILSKHFQTTGQKKIAGFSTIIATGKLFQYGNELPFIQKIKLPNKYIIDISIQGQQLIAAYDGNKYWQIAPWLGSDEGPDAEIILNKFIANICNFEGQLYNYKNNANKVALNGNVEIEGATYYHLILTNRENVHYEIFIDSASNLLYKEIEKIEINNKIYEWEITFHNYKDIFGAKLPYELETIILGESALIKYDNYEIGKPIDDHIFTQPRK